MGKRRSVDPELLRRARSTVEAKRPKCPTCGLHCPSKEEGGGAAWLQTFGHRCPHGEPCPGWHDPGEFVEVCYQCKVVPIRKEQTSG